MTTLKCTQENRHNTTVKSPVNHENNGNTKKEDDLIDLFPLPRYFQVHFEHIHDNTHDVQGKLNHLNHDIQSQLDQIKQTLAKVEDKLDRYMALLGHHIEPGH
jgi:hypothetical protein